MSRAIYAALVTLAGCTTRVTGPDVRVIVNQGDGGIETSNAYEEAAHQDGLVNRSDSAGDEPGVVKFNEPKTERDP